MPPLERSNSAAAYAWIVRGELLASRTNREDAVNFMLGNRAPAEAVRVVRSPIGAADTADVLGGDHPAVVSGFVESLMVRTAYFRMLQDNAFRKVPLRTRVYVTTTPAVGLMTAEGKAKSLSKLVLQALTLEPVKAAAQCAFTNESLMDVSALAMAHFSNELLAAAAKAVDLGFFELITDTGTPSAPSSGTSATNAKTDLRNLLLSLSIGDASKLYYVGAPDVCEKAATLSASGGLDAFPAMSPLGGEMTNLPVIASSALPAGSLFLIDANSIAAGFDTIERPRRTRQADMEMSTTPTSSSAAPTPAIMTSLWQTDSTGMQTDIWFGAAPLRDCVSIVTGIDWGASP